MKPYLVKTPKLVQRTFPKRIWAFPNEKSKVYLTFDDGPIPEVTPWVLDTLKSNNAKATFFCIGDNVQKHGDIFNRILIEGHSIGNHTFNHLNSRRSNEKEYLENVALAQTTLGDKNKAMLFRPPYGQLSIRKEKLLRNQGYKIVMWDVLSYDFDATISEEKCLENVLKHIKPGSIVVFHDSLKAENNLRFALPKVLKYIAKKQWKCAAIA